MTFALFSAGTWCHQEVQGDGNYAYWSRPDETEDLASHQRGQKNQDQIENDDKNDGTRRVWRAAWDGRSFCGWLLFLAINRNLWNLKTLDTMGSQIFTGLLFYAYVEIHQVRRLVFDNYQRCPVSLSPRLALCLFVLLPFIKCSYHKEVGVWPVPAILL